MTRRITALVELIVTFDTESSGCFAEDIVDGMTFGVTDSKEDTSVEDIQINSVTIDSDEDDDAQRDLGDDIDPDKQEES